MKKPIIFLIEEDDDARPLFRMQLKTYGYEVSLAVDEGDALERTSRGSLDVDLILVNLCRKAPEEMLEFAAGLALKVPVVAIAAKFSAEMEGKKNEYVAYLEDGEQLYDLLDRLLPSRDGSYSGD